MTRFLVDPVRERMGDLRGCTGATMEDGTVYRANRGGAFEVDRPDHAAAIRRDPKIAGDIVAETFHARADGGRYCAGECSPTELWPWSKTCPRCGGPTKPGEEGSQ